MKTSPLRLRYAKSLDTDGTNVLRVYDVAGSISQRELDDLLPVTYCTHSYDCCGRWYRGNRAQKIRTDNGVVVLERMYMNV